MEAFGTSRRMAPQHGKRGFFKRSHGFRARIGVACAVFDGGGIQILEVRDELIQRRIRQIDAGLGNMPLNVRAGIKSIHLCLSVAHAGLTPAT